MPVIHIFFNFELMKIYMFVKLLHYFYNFLMSGKHKCLWSLSRLTVISSFIKKNPLAPMGSTLTGLRMVDTLLGPPSNLQKISDTCLSQEDLLSSPPNISWGEVLGAILIFWFLGATCKNSEHFKYFRILIKHQKRFLEMHQYMGWYLPTNIKEMIWLMYASKQNKMQMSQSHSIQN